MVSTPIYVLDQNYDAYDVIDTYKSFIWADRYSTCGDFEIYIPATEKSVDSFRKDEYIRFRDSDRYMVIENINLETSIEDGDYLIISGRSLECILSRRIIWDRTILSGNFQEGIKTLLGNNIISPSISERAIPNFIFKESTDSRITELTLDAQYFGENLYDVIEKLCTERNLGFKVLPVYPGGFEFSLYFGEDRSYSQNENPWVIFSPKFQNLTSSNYLSSYKNFKNAALVAGEDDGDSRVTEMVTSENFTGLRRRELFVDAYGLTNDTSSIETDPELTDEEKQDLIAEMTERYHEQLKQKGNEELSSAKPIETFDGEVDAQLQFIYGRDFYLGDTVQIVNEYGMKAASRISEIVFSYDESGKIVTPTFTVISDSGKEQII